MNILVFIPILIISCNRNNKIQTFNENIEDANVHISTEIQGQEDLNKIMYVNSPEGLRVRNLPSINGDRIGLLDYFTEVKIIKEDNDIVSIEGIEGKWVNIITPIEGWIFDGFLENEEQYKNSFNKTIEEKIIGDWRVLKGTSEDDDETSLFFSILIFKEDGSFLCGPYGTGVGWGGEWRVDNGIIRLRGRGRSDSDSDEEIEKTVFETKYFTDIKILNDDNITLYNGLDDVFQKLRKLKW
jgi:hypothetical protein